MRPYNNIRLTEDPDVADIRSEGRRSAIGRVLRNEKFMRYVNGSMIFKTRHSDRGYASSKAKAIMRRALKKADRNKETLPIEQ